MTYKFNHNYESMELHLIFFESNWIYYTISAAGGIDTALTWEENYKSYLVL